MLQNLTRIDKKRKGTFIICDDPATVVTEADMKRTIAWWKETRELLGGGVVFGPFEVTELGED